MVILCTAFVFGMIYFLIVATLADEISMWNTTWPCLEGFNAEAYHPVTDMVVMVLPVWFVIIPVGMIAAGRLGLRDGAASA